ncbi:uncharacterized protein LOC116415998 [Nasonia vitripennis]|uniref:Integrase catalytic domain-containing protein n=1 Tax=Nasonia vitripennis TaxID=7425 RepID=A0A7M7PZK4_NASVI|nr:uncharacterized protein LOC116415998 [Nasonia vitripennis]
MDSQLMTTAVVKIQDFRGNFIVARALLDTCSNVNLVSEKFAKKLNLIEHSCLVNIGAVDQLCTVSKSQISTTLQSSYNKFQANLHLLLVPNIAEAVPNEAFPRDRFDIPKHIQLADPQFHLPKPIDLLLASKTTLSTFAVGQIKLRNEETRSEIILQKTRLGWLVAGGVDPLTSSKQASCNIVKVDKLLERFWQIEEFPNEPVRSREEIACEEHYVAHTTRDPVSGRYTVRLPFKDNKFELGSSRSQALRRYYSLERRFEKDPKLKADYYKVMEEYITLGHMTPNDDTEDGCYLPHHVVVKESSETTQYRVVFDASSKTSTGISLNDILLVGPTIQNTIFEQVLRFRSHLFVVTADIEKMYRQILVHPEDRKFQKVLWPDPKTGKLRTWALNTVTFGMAAAPFLAIRTIHQLAHDEAKDFPRASKLLIRDFYVDDFVSGADSFEEILAIRDEMIALLRRGGFLIRKWASNHRSILDKIDSGVFELDHMVKETPIQKTLGIIWDSENDQLKYTVVKMDNETTVTKRRLLSEISKIFDPLGLLGPIILYAKVLMQDCWKSKVNWDESLSQDVYTKWHSFSIQLPLLTEFSIPRTILIANPIRSELHGFCDACISGYGACLFVKSYDALGHVSIRLLCSKSRVASLKGLTIPKLELSAAVVLRKLLSESKSQLHFSIDQIYLWSDSTIVLFWLKKSPHVLQTFEANRVSYIQSLPDIVHWRHVKSEDNPADSLSRGQLPSEFLANSLWNSGPDWLRLPEGEWPESSTPCSSVTLGLKRAGCFLTKPAYSEIYLRFSSFERFVRVVAFILRWKRIRSQKKPERLFPEISESKDRISKILQLIRPLEVSELLNSEDQIIFMVQSENFSIEIRQLKKFPNLKTWLGSLHPFIKDDKLLRVGGRLKLSDLPYNQKHPVLLPSKHPVTDMIIRQVHRVNLHAGIQSTLSSIRSKYWILNGKNQVRNVVRHCVECIRQRPTIVHAQMADLPKTRINESPAFSHVGVDFFGPILIKEKKDRNRSFIKTYGCVFVCLACKAVHIELATDLSSEGFMAAFDRFISRRGVPEHVYSDNGTNFVGASNELREVYDLFETPEFRKTIGTYAIAKRIEWHFNPPLSPHFGGIWEAAVKSFKHHLKRVLKDQKLTYEQINTLLIQIEAILNSRPLCSLSTDPNDPVSITPAHLLVGRPFNVLPEKSVFSVPGNRLSTYKFLTKMRQDFWNKWHKEYLHELQTRQKWHDSTAELIVGSVVILMDDITYCSRWPLGVIVEVHPGSDGIARVASVKTSTGIYKRNITRLCILPTT